QRPTVPGVHGLEHVEGFPAAYLTDHDAIRAHSKRRAEERAHVDSSGAFDARCPRFKCNDVGLRQSELSGVLDGHDAFAIADSKSERVEGRGLAARGAAGNEHASPLAHRAHEVSNDIMLISTVPS